MTFEEYKTKQAAIDEYVLICPKDDSPRDVLYQFNLGVPFAFSGAARYNVCMRVSTRFAYID